MALQPNHSSKRIERESNPIYYSGESPDLCSSTDNQALFGTRGSQLIHKYFSTLTVRERGDGYRLVPGIQWMEEKSQVMELMGVFTSRVFYVFDCQYFM